MTITLANLRKELARETGQGTAGTCSSTGTTTTLIDATLGDVYGDAKSLNNVWIYRPAAAAADQLRIVDVDGYAAASGTLTVTRAWSAAPTSGEAYELYPLLPAIGHAASPYSFLRAINDGLRRCYFVDDIVLGRGTDKGERRYYFQPAEVTMIAVVVVEGGTGITITPPSGWTLIRRTDDSTTLSVATYYRRARIDDAHTFTWTITSAIAGGIILAYADAEVQSPVDVSAGQANTSAATSAAPTATTTVADAKVLRVHGTALATAFAAAATQQERFDLIASYPVAGVGAFVSDVDQATAGATGALSATMGGADASIAQTIALAPKDADRRVAFVAATGGHNSTGGTTLVLPRPSSAANDDWTPTRAAIQKVLTRRHYEDGTPYGEANQDTNGRDWYWLDDPAGVELLFAPHVDDEVVVKVARFYPALANESDETDCPTALAVAASRYALYAYLNGASTSRGAYAVELAEALREFRTEIDAHRIATVVRGA